MTVIVRTHGGLGNQIFQIFFARLYAQALETDYVELHDNNYKHKFARSSEIRPTFTTATKRQKFISDLRIPKLLLRSHLYKTEKTTIFGDTFLDGYFQQASDYLPFSDAHINAQIEVLRKELHIEHDNLNSCTLYHLRLGDFFLNNKEAKAHTLERLEELEPGSVIISNQEEIFRENTIQDKLRDKDCILHSTAGYTSEDTIRLMSKYRKIVTNNSTLAFWASILGDCQTEFSDPKLATIHSLLSKIANKQ